MKRIGLLAFLVGLPLLAAPPDFSANYRFTNRLGEPTDGKAVYNGAARSIALDNTAMGCSGFQINYASEGLTGVSVNLQTNTKIWFGGLSFGVGPTWSTFGGTATTGSLPMTGLSQGLYVGYGSYPYVAINVATFTGTGSIDVTFSCWKSITFAQAIGGGGGTIPNTTNILIGGPSNTAADSGVGILFLTPTSFFMGPGAGNASITAPDRITGLGYHALNALTTGTTTTAVGANALEHATTGSDNAAFGTGACNMATTGSNNMCIGTSAAYNNQTGSNNVAIGNHALLNIGDTSDNVAIGYKAFNGGEVSGKFMLGTRGVAIGSSAGSANQGANDNTFVGYTAGLQTTTGGTNTVLGSLAFFSNISSTDNTCAGYECLREATGGNNTGLGSLAGEGPGGGFPAGGYPCTTCDHSTFIGNQANILTPGTQTSYMTVIGAGAQGVCNSCVVLGRQSSDTAYYYRIATATNCSNAAAPAACASSAAGSVAIPTGTNSTLTVNTTAVTAASQIILTSDDSVTIAATTCNSTLATLVGGMAITSRTAGTSFTISFNGTITTNKLCVNYQILN